MRAKTQVVVNCGAAHVSVAVFSGREGAMERGKTDALRLEAYGRENFVSVPAHSAAWPVQVAAALEVVLLHLRIKKGAECRLCLPGHLVLSKCVRTPAVAVERRTEMLHFEAAQHIPFALDKVAWAALELGQRGDELDLLLAAARLEALEPLCAAVEAAGLIPCACEPASLALWRAFTLAPPTDASTASLLIDVGTRSTQVVLGSPVAGVLAWRTIPLGGDWLTSAIAQTQGIEFAEAEALKRHCLAADSDSMAASAVADASLADLDELKKLAADFSTKLARELTLTQLSYLRQSGAESPLGLYMCGGGSVLPGLCEKLAESLGLPVAELSTPEAGQNASTTSVNAGAAASDLLALQGCALGVCLPEAQRLDLLPQPRRVQGELKRRRRWYWAAAAVLALAPMPLLIGQRAAIAHAREQAASAAALMAPLLGLSASNAEAEARLLGLQGRLTQVHALNAERTSWLRFLADLQARLSEVGDAWLERLHYAAPATETASGEALTGAARVEISGCVLENRRADEAIQQLFERLQSSEFVQDISRERYDRSRPGLIRFDAELLINPGSLL